jgi:hypothetical protein
MKNGKQKRPDGASLTNSGVDRAWQLRGGLYVAVWRVTLYQADPTDLQSFEAACPHHVSYLLNMILKLFGSFLSG